MPKPLWAPWRMAYIRAASKECASGRTECIFCGLLKCDDDEAALILHRDRHAFVVMNRFPYNNGHLMVVPNRHVGDYERLRSEEGRELHRLAQVSMRALRLAFKPDGYNVGMNLGRVAGAGVVDHVHTHIVPRWLGDVNYMPLLAETKVIGEHLSDTYQHLRKRFRRLR